MVKDDDDEEERERKVGHTEGTFKSASEAGWGEDSSDILAATFKSLATSNDVLSRQAIMEWEEVRSLMKEGLLGQDEFDNIWEELPKVFDGQNIELVNFQGFLTFNERLDDLFEFEDLEDDAGDAAAQVIFTSAIYDDDDNPEALFEALLAADGYVGKDELQRWGDLQEMLSVGELLPKEVEEILDEVTKKSKEPPNKLNKYQFCDLYHRIDALFEEEEHIDDGHQVTTFDERLPQEKASKDTTFRSKEELLLALAKLNEHKDRLPCGLEATEEEQGSIQEIVSALESNSANIVRQKQGSIEMSDVVGEWDLLYSSSAAMAYNKGLSGLGGSVPNGSFGGLKMKLTATNFLTDLEYVERINVVPDSASFDVTINGDWELRSNVSMFTGDPSIVLTVVPEKVTYGPTSTRADHWKSLGPTNMMDVTYLDDDIRVMRGNTSTNSILVFQRVK